MNIRRLILLKLMQVDSYEGNVKRSGKQICIGQQISLLNFNEYQGFDSAQVNAS
jgi:hypothetical protein